MMAFTTTLGFQRKVEQELSFRQVRTFQKQGIEICLYLLSIN